MKTINDFNFKNQKALIRVDFNVPLNEALQITDDTRIQAAIPTITKILKDGGSCVLMSHLGRPKGKETKFSLKNIVAHLSTVLGLEVIFGTDAIHENTLELAKNLKNGQVLLIENLRFYEEEKAGDKDFAQKLAQLGDIYVNDAFGTAHRAHASTAVIADFFADKKCFGALLEKEIIAIDKVLKNSDKPVTAILGGAKVSSKITIIENILDKVDNLIIGGGMIFTFLKALGGKVGSSLVEDDKLELALKILADAKAKNVKIILAKDVLIADKFSNDANTQVVNGDEIPEGWMGLDVAEKTLEEYKEVILNSKTILWNGPAGVFEFSNFANGTKQIGHFIEEATQNGAFSLVGGGDSVAAVKQFGFQDAVSYISTGGGAMLECLEGKTLPGIAAILK